MAPHDRSGVQETVERDSEKQRANGNAPDTCATIGLPGSGGNMASVPETVDHDTDAAALRLGRKTGATLGRGFLVLVGGLALAVGVSNLKRVRAKPEETIETIKEDVEWLKQVRRSARGGR
jgi:hypothetical protein